MVDALHRARRWMKPRVGVGIDLRPADVVARVEVLLRDRRLLDIGGLIVEDQRRVRHGAADRALARVVEDRVFAVEREQEFSMLRYPDSPDDLRDHIVAKWPQTQLASETYSRASDLLAENPDATLRLREQVAIRVLRP